MNSIIIDAPAKINLGLDVIRRRPDGYHEVRMIMLMLELHDSVTITRSDMPGIKLSTNLHFLPCDSKNIAFRAAGLMFDNYLPDAGVSIDIFKRIPVAAGMAGGSTDGAAVLIGINKLFSLGLTTEKLMELGLKLGTDVPFCVMKQTALSEGIGELLTPLPGMPKCSIVSAAPPFSVSTKHVYQSLVLDETIRHPDIDGMIQALKDSSLEGITSRLSNVLETVTIKEHPEIDDIKQTLMNCGAMGALMSGSGPSVFGLFNNSSDARNACNVLNSSGFRGSVILTKPLNTGCTY